MDMEWYVDTRLSGGRSLFMYNRQVQMREWLYRYESPQEQPVVTYNGDMRKVRRERVRQSIRRRENFLDEDARQRQRVRYNPVSDRARNARNNVPQQPHPTAPAQGSRYINVDIRVHPEQWGVNHGDRNVEGRDFRPAQHRPPQAHWRAPVGDPASPADHEGARAPLPALAQC